MRSRSPSLALMVKSIHGGSLALSLDGRLLLLNDVGTAPLAGRVRYGSSTNKQQALADLAATFFGHVDGVQISPITKHRLTLFNSDVADKYIGDAIPRCAQTPLKGFQVVTETT